MSAEALSSRFAGGRKGIFGLSLRTALLTVFTLGVYRFWMKTRLRRWYWASVQPGGHPLEYTGQPLEKLLGFLIAVVFLAFHIGIVNLILMFLSFSIFNGNVAAYVLSFIGVLPLMFYAQYRGRRFLLARTRWRGIRFGLEPGAWGYAWRGLFHWSVTLLTLGLLLPRQTFWLEKYWTDRTSFGTQLLAQGGRWWHMYPAAILLYLGLGGLVVALWPFLSDEVNEFRFMSDPGHILKTLFALFILLVGYLTYRADSLRYLTAQKRFADPMVEGRPVQGPMRPTPKLVLPIKSWRVVMIYVLGNILAGLCFLPVLVLIGFIVSVYERDALIQTDSLWQNIPQFMFIIGGIVLYFTVFVLWGVLSHTYVRMPLWRYYTRRLEILQPDALSRVGQRARDQFDDAEGFAEALDIGGAI